MGSPVAPPPPSPAVDPGEAARGRRLHYGEFYGLRPLPPDDGRPLVVVHGNCQAESLRVLLAGSLRSVRVPPVHELERDDLPHLRRTLAHASVLLSQPVRPGLPRAAAGHGAGDRGPAVRSADGAVPGDALCRAVPVPGHRAVARGRPTRGALPRPALGDRLAPCAGSCWMECPRRRSASCSRSPVGDGFRGARSSSTRRIPPTRCISSTRDGSPCAGSGSSATP